MMGKNTDDTRGHKKAKQTPKPFAGAGLSISRSEEPQAAFATKQTKTVLDFMGMSGKNSTKDLDNETDFIYLIRKGVPKKVLDHLMDRIGLSTGEMEGILHISARTLRRHTPQTLLNQEQSERLIELARLYSRGEDVFGDLDRFRIWMDSPVVALGNIKPKSYLDTSLGIDMLMNELGRIEHGIFA